MYELTSKAVTVIKKKPVQSIELSNSDKKTILPGQYFKSNTLYSAQGNHSLVNIDNADWYIYNPHWNINTQKIIVTLEDLTKVYPFTSRYTLSMSVKSLNDGMERYQINHNPKRVAAYLAQLGHESAGLRYTVELASGNAYEGRRDLGNTQSGDGPRFKGRGWIQLTGRNNYRTAGKALNLELEDFPDLAATVGFTGLISAWFWDSRNLNYWADREDFLTITRLINGGTNGLSDRQQYWERAKKVFYPE